MKKMPGSRLKMALIGLMQNNFGLAKKTVKELARKRYWDLRENGIERKNFGLERMRYIALLGNIGHFRRQLR